MKIIQSLWLLLPALLDLIGDFFLLGKMSKPLDVHSNFEGEGVDELFWFALGVRGIGIGGMPG